jgi:Flp pilus assembly protein TadD
VSELEGIPAARLLLQQGSPRLAAELLKRTLSEWPDDATAHALLAIALHDLKRLYAAEHEATEALRLEPDLPEAHLAHALILLHQRRVKEACAAAQQAAALNPEDDTPYLILARAELLRGARAIARKYLDMARRMDPENVETLTDLGDLELREGNLDAAEKLARLALDLAPESTSAIVLLGWVHLRRGDSARARELARWALTEDADGTSALALLVAVKARESLLLGAWWRFNALLAWKSDAARSLMLVGGFLAFQTGAQLARDLSSPTLGSTVQYVWLAIVAYSWFGVAIFTRMLTRELETVRLRPDF